MRLAFWRKREEPKYEPKALRDGIQEIAPPAVYRKLRQCKMAMIGGDRGLIVATQQSLMKGGWEVPTTPSECDLIEMRLREHAAKAAE